MTLFVPNELETHLITMHGVRPQALVQNKKLSVEKGFDYQEFLETNHRFIHAMRRGEQDHEDEEL